MRSRWNKGTTPAYNSANHVESNFELKQQQKAISKQKAANQN